MKPLIFIALFSLFVVCCVSVPIVDAGDGIWHVDVEILSTDNPRQYLASLTNIYDAVLTVNIAMIPCFGDIDVYTGYDAVPTTVNFFSHKAWDSTASLQELSVELVDLNSTIYVLFTGNKLFGSASLSAAFHFVMWTNQTGFDINEKYPLVQNLDLNPKLQTKGATVSWHKTSNSNDNYTVYYSSINSKNLNSESTGLYALTGCSVERAFSQYTKDVSIKDNGDGTQTATISNLDTTKITPVSVVVSRVDGLSAAYETVYLNAAINLNALPSFLFFIIAVAILIY